MLIKHILESLAQKLYLQIHRKKKKTSKKTIIANSVLYYEEARLDFNLHSSKKTQTTNPCKFGIISL